MLKIFDIAEGKGGYFLNFLLKPIRPNIPEPNKSAVGGMGTTAGGSELPAIHPEVAPSRMLCI
jgi:hypothetical protein